MLRDLLFQAESEELVKTFEKNKLYLTILNAPVPSADQLPAKNEVLFPSNDSADNQQLFVYNCRELIFKLNEEYGVDRSGNSTKFKEYFEVALGLSADLAQEGHRLQPLRREEEHRASAELSGRQSWPNPAAFGRGQTETEHSEGPAAG